jgi:iduronate 2-sulfatase
MNSFLQRFAAIFLIILLLAGSAWAQPARPNVLFIALDDLRTTVGCYGDEFSLTPNIDRLAERGTQFMRAYCAQAVCNPSRASTLTGRRPDTIRVWDLTTNFRTSAPDVVPVPEYFKQQGYDTRNFGKIYHNTPGTLDAKSWSEPAQFEERKNYYALPENEFPTSGGWKQASTENADVDDDEYIDGKVAAAAAAALEEFASAPGGKPFFLAVGIRKPHVPFVAPKRYWDMYKGRTPPPLSHSRRPKGSPALAFHNSEELRGYRDIPKHRSLDGEAARLRLAYYVSTTFADAQVGRVIDALDRTGLNRSTIVVLWSDHGYHMGEFGLWTKNTNYEAATRVPFMIATPLHRPGGKVRGFVELIDIFPTLTELCGLRKPDGLEGMSLFPI